MVHAGVPPIERGEGLVGPGRAQGVLGFRTALGAGRYLVVEALADLVDGNDVFPACGTDVMPNEPMNSNAGCPGITLSQTSLTGQNAI